MLLAKLMTKYTFTHYMQFTVVCIKPLTYPLTRELLKPLSDSLTKEYEIIAFLDAGDGC